MEDVSKAPQLLTCSGRARVGVDLHHDRLVGMPQDSHDHGRMCSSGSVNVSSVFDAEDHDFALDLIDSIQDTVGAAPG